MSVAPHSGVIDFGTFTPPTASLNGIQGEVPEPLIGQANYVLTGNGWLSLGALGALTYQGTWDASSNTPTLVSSVGTQGYYYVVSVAGNTNLNGITTWAVGDWAVFNGSVWQRIESSVAFGTMAYQNANAVAITGGSIDGTTIGATTPSTGKFTSLTDSALTIGRLPYAGTGGLLQDNANLQFTGSNLLIGQTYDQGTGSLQNTGTATINGNLVDKQLYLQGGNNYVPYSQDLSQSTWNKAASGISAATTTAASGTAPDGTNTATQIVFSATTATNQQGQLYRGDSVTYASGTTWTFSIWLKATSNVTTYIGIIDGGTNVGTNATCNVTTSWQKFTVTRTMASATTVFVEIGPDTRTGLTPNQSATQSSVTVLAWGAQFEQGSQASSYTPTTTAAVTTTNNISVPSGSITISNGSLSLSNAIAFNGSMPTVASASSITVTKPSTFISGTTTINTIAVPSSFTSGGGQIVLIPTGLWSTGTSGNIALATTAVVSKALILIYDPTSAKWYPSY